MKLKNCFLIITMLVSTSCSSPKQVSQHPSAAIIIASVESGAGITEKGTQGGYSQNGEDPVVFHENLPPLN